MHCTDIWVEYENAHKGRPRVEAGLDDGRPGSDSVLRKVLSLLVVFTLEDRGGECPPVGTVTIADEP